MSVIMSNVNARMDLDVALKSLAPQIPNFNPQDISQSDLILEAQLLPSKSAYQFQVMANTNNPGTDTSPTEIRLDMNDAFYCTHVQYAIMAHTVPGGTPDILRYVPFLFPSSILSETGVTFSYLGYKLWWGVLNILVNKVQIVSNWSVMRHMYIPETQKDAYNGPFPVSTFYAGNDQQDGSTSGWYPMEPNVVFLGNDNVQILVNFPEDLNNAIASVADGFTTKAVLRFRGLLVKNVTKTANKRS